MPWSFLRRRRSSDESPAEIAEVKEAFDTEVVSVDLGEQPSVSVPSPVKRPDPETKGEVTSEPSVSAVSVENKPTPSPIDAVDIHDDRLATLPNLRRRRQTLRNERDNAVASPKRGRLATSKADNQKAPPVDHGPRSIDASVSDVSVLDQEIKQLRRQLVEKLRLQNAQLDKMLQRFDPS